MFADHSARVSSPHCAALSPAAAAMEFDALAPLSSSLSSPPSSLSSPSPLTDASSSSSSREELQRPTQASKRRRNRKKPCHIAQKERRESVVQELALLEARVRELRLKAGAPSLDEIQETEARALENAQLRSAQETYKLVLASAHSSFSSYTNRQYESPLGRPIDLPANWEQRMSLLEGMREEVVMSAYQYLMERTRQMDPLQETAEESKFYSPEGDYCVVKIDNTPFFDASGPEEVLQAYYEYVQQLEVTLSVASGSVITREGVEIKEDGLSSHRFCTTASGVDVPMEKNSVGFTGTVPSSLGPIHVVVLSVVGKDELYPYRPNERVRNDLSGVVTISRRVGPDGGPPVVTMTRYYHIKVYRTPLLPRSSDAEGLHETIHRIHSNMITEIKWHVERNRQARAALLGKQ